MKHHETLEQSSFDATILALDAQTSALDMELSAFGAATSATARRSFDETKSALNAESSALDAETSELDAETSALGTVTSVIARSYRRYRCGVGITPQMCNRVTNHGDMSTFSKPVLYHINAPIPCWKIYSFLSEVPVCWSCSTQLFV